MKIIEKHALGSRLRRMLQNSLLVIVMLVAFLGFFAACWYVRIYGRIGFDSVIFTLTGGLGGVSTDLLEKFITGAVLPAVVCTAAAAVLLFWPWNWKRWIPVTVSLVLSVGLLVHAAFNVELVEYILNSKTAAAAVQTPGRERSAGSQRSAKDGCRPHGSGPPELRASYFLCQQRAGW